MIVVTGAGGKTGQAVVGALAGRGQRVRGLVRRPEQCDTLLAQGAIEAVVGNLADEAILRVVTNGATAVYHICPNMHPHEEAIGRAVIAAAQAAGVGHLVYHSVLHPQVEAMPHHWQKLRVEEALFASGLTYTILQPTAYMQNLLGGWQQIVAIGVLANPYPPATRLSLVDLADVGQAAAIVLTEPGHEFATYELAGTPPLSQLQVAAELSTHLGRTVVAEEIPLESWTKNARTAGLSTYAVDTLRQMFLYYARHGLPGNPNVLHWLLGRKPTTLAGFLRAGLGIRD
jgi:NAD(P)H dehydrogenase (quinone)